MLSTISMLALSLVGVLLIIIVLLQRGRGGGLAGAFGGLGGQSAFGTKAGDVFTKITIVLAVIWVVLAGASGFALRWEADRFARQLAGAEEDEEDFRTPGLRSPEGADPPTRFDLPDLDRDFDDFAPETRPETGALPADDPEANGPQILPPTEDGAEDGGPEFAPGEPNGDQSPEPGPAGADEVE